MCLVSERLYYRLGVIMNEKILILAIISCINADQLNIEILPPAHVANVFHESGITFVSPTSRNLEISSPALAPPLPLTHAFGFVSQNPNRPQELVRTHSFQPVTHGLHSSVTVLHSPNGINTNINGQITSHRNDNGDDVSASIDNNVYVDIQPPRADVVQARFVENDFHGVHEINSKTQHFEYKVPLVRNLPHTIEHHENVPDHHHDIHFTEQVEFKQHSPMAKHSIYGVPSQDKIDSFPGFQDDQVLSPVILHNTPTIHSSNKPLVQTIRHTDTPRTHSKHEPQPQTIRHTNTPIHSSNEPLPQSIHHTNIPSTPFNNEPLAQTIDNIFDSTFPSNLPAPHTSGDGDLPTVHSKKPTTTQNSFVGNNNQYKNRFVLSDGTTVAEEGKLISPIPGWENIIAKTGEYSYISPEGIPVKVKWIADHEGFRVLS
ncbi:hypothetical protein Bhyg_04478 [Pseudolycoriella hygida]|uniref:Uncharacterized protein n=1 Tax=Pseudolycoriella hygida TaxID=35572 RepID=A0A9Q0NFE8_9DIPT|nr:hypothetical protein Bhyg_04478 [Pseudolycoriella hygida]